MTDINPLSVLIAKWTDDDNPESAIYEMDLHAFDLMKQYSDGVPTVVMTTAIEKGLDYVGQLFAGMIIDVMADQKGWTDEERGVQIYLSRMAQRMLRGEAWIDALNEHMPPASGVEEGSTEET